MVKQSWQAFDFFRAKGGLSPITDSVQMEICYDIELVLECSSLIERILAWKDRMRAARAWIKSSPSDARSMWLPEECQKLRRPWRPFVPTVAVFCPWFPANWLCGSAVEREKIVTALTPAYSRLKPLRLDLYPLSTELEQIREQRLRQSMEWDNRNRSRNYKRYILTIDWTELPTRIIQRFALWVTQNNPEVRQQELYEDLFGHLRGSKHYDELILRIPRVPKQRSAQQNRNARWPLERLTAYRLSKLSITEREAILDMLNLRSTDLSHKLKRARAAVEKDLQARGYLHK